MKTFGSAVLGLVGGLFLGFVLSEVVAIAAYLLIGEAPWLAALRFLPLVLGLVGLAGAPVIVRRFEGGVSPDADQN